MEKRVFKDTVYSAIAGLTKAFSNSNRLEIIDLLANGEKTVEQVATQTAISVANASQHLQVLKNAKVLKSRRSGNFIFYSINGKKAYAAWKALRDLALEVEPVVETTLHRYRKGFGGAESLSLKTLASADQALLLDVRPSDEFAAGSLPDAVSIPIGELPHRLSELPRTRTIVPFCRGSFCTFADEAVLLLKSNGFHAVRLEESYLDHRLLHDESWKN